MDIRTGSLTILMAGTCFCCSGRLSTAKVNPVERAKALAEAKLGPSADRLSNSSNTAILWMVTSKPSSEVPQRQVSFLIYDALADSITFEQSIPNGSVRWEGDETVIVEIIPGIEKLDESSPPNRHGYLIDVRTGITREFHPQKGRE